MTRDLVLDYLAAACRVDVAAHSPNRPTEFRLTRHLRGEMNLIRLWRDLGYVRGAEIGTERGLYAHEIARGIPGVSLTCVDPWRAYSRYFDEVSQDKLDACYAEATARLAPYPNVRLLRLTSLEAVSRFEPASLDFVFIDGNHEFEYVVNDIIHWARIVRPGGMVAGHDYKNEAANHRIPFHVVPAIHAYTDAYGIKPWFVIRGDKAASWFFIKGDA